MSDADSRAQPPPGDEVGLSESGQELTAPFASAQERLMNHPAGTAVGLPVRAGSVPRLLPVFRSRDRDLVERQTGVAAQLAGHGELRAGTGDLRAEVID